MLSCKTGRISKWCESESNISVGLIDRRSLISPWIRPSVSTFSSGPFPAYSVRSPSAVPMTTSGRNLLFCLFKVCLLKARSACMGLTVLTAVLFIHRLTGSALWHALLRLLAHGKQLGLIKNRSALFAISLRVNKRVKRKENIARLTIKAAMPRQHSVCVLPYKKQLPSAQCGSAFWDCLFFSEGSMPSHQEQYMHPQ